MPRPRTAGKSLTHARTTWRRPRRAQHSGGTNAQIVARTLASRFGESRRRQVPAPGELRELAARDHAVHEDDGRDPSDEVVELAQRAGNDVAAGPGGGTSELARDETERRRARVRRFVLPGRQRELGARGRESTEAIRTVRDHDGGKIDCEILRCSRRAARL